MSTIVEEEAVEKKGLRFCSVVAKAAGEDPIGSAWSTTRALAIEVPLPWPESFIEARGFPPGMYDVIFKVYDRYPETGFVGIAPDPVYSRAGMTRLIDYRADRRPRARAERHEFLVPTARVAEFVLDLFSDDLDLGNYPDAESVPGDFRDLLVCTHGTVDACCASFGFPLYRQLRELVDETENVRVWRCTHFGGHRFAPTLLDLPEARYWGFLGPETGRELIMRTGHPAALRLNYRGWAGYEEGGAQLLEREALVREGWAWTEWPQEIEILGRDAEDEPDHLRIIAYPPDRPPIQYEGRIVTTGEIETLGETGGEPFRIHVHAVVDLMRRELLGPDSRWSFLP
jgi:hypothetical protein